MKSKSQLREKPVQGQLPTKLEKMTKLSFNFLGSSHELEGAFMQHRSIQGLGIDRVASLGKSAVPL